MPRRPPAPPKFLLSVVSAVITSFVLVYGVNTGWFSPFMIYFYLFLVCYYAVICNGNRIATAYTINGAVVSTVILLAFKFLDPILGTIIGITAVYFITVMTRMILESDWRYFSAQDFMVSPFPLEKMIQLTYDQYAIVDNVAAESPTVESPERNETGQRSKQKKKPKSPPAPSLSRKERKVEAKKQNVKGKNPNVSRK